MMMMMMTPHAPPPKNFRPQPSQPQLLSCLYPNSTILIPYNCTLSSMGNSRNKRGKREANRQRTVEALARAQSGADTGAALQLPQKKFYRQRAHANPFSDHQLK